MYKPYRKLEEPDDDHLPELVTDHDHASPKIALSAEYAAAEGLESVSAAPYSDSPDLVKSEDPRQRKGPVVNLEYDDSASKAPARHGRRKLRLFLIIIVIVVILAIVLGATLGSILSKKTKGDNTAGTTPGTPSNSTNNFNFGTQIGLAASNGTGLAAARLADANPQQFLVYFQMDNGTVVEEHYSNAAVSSLGASSTNLTGYSANAMNIANISSNSPLVATSYTDEVTGLQTRYLFYVDQIGTVYNVNASNSSSTFGAPQVVSYSQAAVNSPCLSVCWTRGNGLWGIRVYHGLAQGGILESIWNFNPSKIQGWHNGQVFAAADKSSGVDCTTGGSTNDQYLNLYFRNLTTGNLGHWYYDQSNDNTVNGSWNYVNEKNAIHDPPANGSSIKAIQDAGQANVYTFWQGDDGYIKEGTTTLWPPSPVSAPQNVSASIALVGTRIGTTYVDAENMPLVVYQNASGDVNGAVVDRNGRVQARVWLN
ncbi:hypothetical protein MBLNU457_3941t1 [Dothideomycetes sp. NU457]